jgi:serine/threonine-protein kinase
MKYAPENSIPPSSVAPPRYQPIKTLGEGGFGRVLLATDALTQKQVAVKVLKATWSPTHQARFRREVEETKKLRSHRIIKVLGDELANDPPFYVMPYLSRGSLRQYVFDLTRKQQVFTQPAALIAAATIAEGLRIAHDAGVHHRDLKPENLLFNDAGDLVLTDFGLGEFVHRESIVLTIAGPLGTAPYCAPEQWQTGEGSARADFFSLGMILFEMLTGIVPQVQVNPSQCDNRIPAELDALFWRLANPDPDQRFARCTEVLSEIDRLLIAKYQTIRPKKIDWEWWKAFLFG